MTTEEAREKIIDDILSRIDSNLLNKEDVMFDGLALDFDKPKNVERKIRILLYIKNRKLLKMPKAKAFLDAFKSEIDEKYYNDQNYLSSRASSLENTKPFKEIAFVLHSNIYTSFVLDRYKVIDEIKEIALDDSVATRDRIEASKVFLQETRLPDNMTGEQLDNEDIKIIKQIKQSLAAQAKTVEPENFLEMINSKKDGDSIVEAEVVTNE